MHINEDHFIAEIIDPKTEQVLAAGEKGELVITCISKEALPLIRYRTRDITRLMYEPCPCGRSMMDSYAALEKLDYSLREKMRLMLGLDAKIQLVSPNTLQRFEGKAKRVTDLRANKDGI